MGIEAINCSLGASSYETFFHLLTCRWWLWLEVEGVLQVFLGASWKPAVLRQLWGLAWLTVLRQLLWQHLTRQLMGAGGGRLQQLMHHLHCQSDPSVALCSRPRYSPLQPCLRRSELES